MSCLELLSILYIRAMGMVDHELRSTAGRPYVTDCYRRSLHSSQVLQGHCPLVVSLWQTFCILCSNFIAVSQFDQIEIITPNALFFMFVSFWQIFSISCSNFIDGSQYILTKKLHQCTIYNFCIFVVDILYLMYSAFGQDGDFSERGNGGRYHDFLQPLDGADAMKLLNSVWLQC